jgi:hypothetical protein
MLFSFRQFFWRGFLFCVWVQLFYFFSLSFKKNKCAALRWLTKTMTKKLTATPNTALSFGGVSRAVALACSALFCC